MRPGERFGLIQRIYATLSENDWSWDLVDAALSEFGAEWIGGEDAQRRTLERLRTMPDDGLVALTRIFIRRRLTRPQRSPPPRIQPVRGSRTIPPVRQPHYGSQSAAESVRQWMLRSSVDAFVAHSAIEPTREWLDEIDRALRTCHALVAFFTEDFASSHWSDQEVGIAYGRGTLIVPVRMGVDPYGFIGKYQGLTFAVPQAVNHHSGNRLAAQIFELLARHPQTRALMVDPVIRRFAASWSWDNTRAAFPLVQALPRDAWTTERLELVRDAARTNVDIAEGVLADGSGTRVPDALEAHLRSLGLALTQNDEIPF